MRIFVALDIDESIRTRIERFVEGVRGFAPDVRWVRPESLHVTLKFIGEKPDDAVEQIKYALSQAKTSPFDVAFRSYGFFPGAKSPRVFWIGIETGPQPSELARSIDLEMSRVGIPEEVHPYSPHLTLARTGSGSPRRGRSDAPNKRFQQLQEKLAAMQALDFGGMIVKEFFLYQSQLSPKGSRYTKLARFSL